METQQLTFQQAMVRLDEIVRQLNSGNLELEKPWNSLKKD